MPDQHPSDEEIIAEERRRYRHRIRLLAIFIAAMATLLLLSEAYSHHLLGPLGILPAAIVRYFPMLVAVFFLVVIWRNRPSKEARSPRVLRKQIDGHMAQWRLVTLVMVVVVAMSAQIEVNLARHLSGVPPWRAWFQPGAFLFVIVVFSGVAVFGYGFASKSYREAMSDELIRALRARAVRAGYLAMMILLSAAYLAILHGLVSAVTVLPWLLAAGVTIPMLYFLILDWRAGADHE